MTNLARWSLAFTVAVGVVLAAGAALRAYARRAPKPSRLMRADPTTLSSRAAARLRAARQRGLDIPRRRLGGVVLALAIGAGLTFTPVLPGRFVVALLVAVGLVVVGALAELGRVQLGSVVFAPVVAGVITYAGGIRAHPTDGSLLDFLATVLWIAALATAFRGFGDTPGLTAGLGATIALGLFALSGFAEQSLIATMSAALGGACLGFLAYNLRPASLFPGRSGGMLVGFVLAICTIEVEVPIAAPGHLAVPAILLAIPLLDLGMVAVGRIHHGCPLAKHRGDHLTHRLEAGGMKLDVAIGLLIFLQFAMSVVAVFVGRGVLPEPIGLGIAAFVVVVMAFITARQLVYTDATEVRALLWIGGAGLVLLIVASVPAVLAGIEAREMLDDGRQVAEAAVEAARNGEPDQAAAKFAEAAEQFDRARSQLGGPLVTAGLLVPVLSPNLEAARELSDAGVDLARAGERLTKPVDPERLRVRGGQVSLEEVRKITPSLSEAATLLADTRERVDGIETDYLLPPVRDALDEVGRELSRTEIDARRGAEAAVRLPAILGDDGPRRYLLVVQNNAEARATGGIVLFWGVINANNGDIDVEELEPVRRLNEGIQDCRCDPQVITTEDYLRRYSRHDPTHTWQNTNLSPDFPTVGQVMASLFPQSGGFPIDGIVRTDPYGLAALLRLTGSVEVEPWEVPITADNVVQILLEESYRAFANENQRENFNEAVAQAVVDLASEGDLGQPGRIAEVLGEAARQGHLALYFTRPEEQALARLLDADAGYTPPRNDGILVTTNNAGQNKLDYYLGRRLEYDVALDPSKDGETAMATGHLHVTLQNNVDLEADLPIAVVGPNNPQVEAGENYSITSVYSPLAFKAATANQLPLELSTEPELGRNVFSEFFNVPAKSALDLDFAVEGLVPLGPDHWYRLDLGHQPTVIPDHITVKVTVPPGWRIAETRGLKITGSSTAAVELDLTEPETLRVRLERSADRNLWDRLREGP